LYSADQGAEGESRADIPIVAGRIGVLHLLRSIWLSPRRTISEVSREKPGYLFYVLAPVSWAVLFLSLAMVFWGGEWSSFTLVGISLGFGLFCGPLLFILLSYPVHLFYKLLGGKGSPKHIQTCFAWSSVPYVPVLLALILMSILGPSDLFSRYNFWETQTTQDSGFWGSVHVVYGILGDALGFWSMIILLVGISETEKIPKTRVLLALLVIPLVSFIVFFLLGALSGLYS